MVDIPGRASPAKQERTASAISLFSLPPNCRKLKSSIPSSATQIWCPSEVDINLDSLANEGHLWRTILTPEVMTWEARLGQFSITVQLLPPPPPASSSFHSQVLIPNKYLAPQALTPITASTYVYFVSPIDTPPTSFQPAFRCPVHTTASFPVLNVYQYCQK